MVTIHYRYETTYGTSKSAADFFLLKISNNGNPIWKTFYRVESDTSYAYFGRVKNISINKDNKIFIGGILSRDYEGNGGDSEKIYLFKVEEDTPNIIRNNKDGINSFHLSQNYPNPFNPTTIINYTIPNGKNVSTFTRLNVFNILGKEVATLVNKRQPPGNYQVEFDGDYLPSGVYFYRLQSGDFIETKKMVLLR